MSLSHNLKLQEAKDRHREFIYSLSTLDLIQYVERDEVF